MRDKENIWQEIQILLCNACFVSNWELLHFTMPKTYFNVDSDFFQPLELILFERPLSFGPPLHSNENICAECGKSVEIDSKCGLCDLPVCNDICQLGHNHYIECQVLQQVRNSVQDHTLKLKSVLPIRILASKATSEVAFIRAQLFHNNSHGWFLYYLRYSGKEMFFFYFDHTGTTTNL